MTELLLDKFSKTDELKNSTKFKNLGVFDLLGKNLEKFVTSWLSEVGCHNEVKIEGEVHPTADLRGAVYVAKGASVGPGVLIQGPCFIDEGADVRHTAYIRGPSYIGPKAVVGHATEVKASVFLDEAKAGHFAYVGDSILGRDANLGAGTKLANFKLKRNEVRFKHPESGEIVASGLRKFGAVLGSEVNTGCNSVLSPGTLLSPKSLIMPCVHFHGTK